MYDLTGNPILERDWSNGGAVTYRAYGPGIDEPLAEERVNGYGFTFLLHDALNSITAATDGNGNAIYTRRYKAFGQMSATGDNASQSSRLGYTSRESSVGSLMQYRARYYDVGVGRFGTQDSYRGMNSLPASIHRFAFALNNPASYTDPLGHAVWRAEYLSILAGYFSVGGVIAWHFHSTAPDGGYMNVDALTAVSSGFSLGLLPLSVTASSITLDDFSWKINSKVPDPLIDRNVSASVEQLTGFAGFVSSASSAVSASATRERFSTLPTICCKVRRNSTFQAC